MSFEENVKKWVVLDNKIKSLNNEIKTLRQEKSEMTDSIFEYIKSNNLSNAIIKISDGNLKFNQIRQANPLTFKYLEQCLSRCINNKEKMEYIFNYIKNSREYKYVDDIKRTYE